MESESVERWNIETPDKRAEKVQTENRKRAAERRARETTEERERRLESNRLRIARKRASETEFERQQRLSNFRKKLAEKRAKESLEERERRLETNRRRIAERRKSKSDSNKEAETSLEWAEICTPTPEVVSTMATNAANDSTVVVGSGDAAKDVSQVKASPQVNSASKIVVNETKPGIFVPKNLCMCE